jgi:four helix bundle protein
MSAVQTYRDLDAWKMSMRLARECYRLTALFPVFERFGLTQQIRRAAVSVASNLAEGNARRTRQAYINHVNIAIGSLAELETQLILAVELGFVRPPEADATQDLAKQTGRLMLALVHALEASQIAS